jgi:hypothetical protein
MFIALSLITASYVHHFLGSYSQYRQEKGTSPVFFKNDLNFKRPGYAPSVASGFGGRANLLWYL